MAAWFEKKIRTTLWSNTPLETLSLSSSSSPLPLRVMILLPIWGEGGAMVDGGKKESSIEIKEENK